VRHYLTKLKNKVQSIFNRDTLFNILPQKKKIFPAIPLFREAPSIFIAVKNVNWEKAGLVDSWKNLAPFIHWDWGDKHDQYRSDWEEIGKPRFNQELLDRVFEAQKNSKINLFFSYLSGRWVYPKTIEKIRKEGIFTVNLGFDDYHRFWGRKENGQWRGNAGISQKYDLNLTLQSPWDVSKYARVGARADFLLPGGNETAFYPVEIEKKNIPVSFIGQAYGERSRLLNYLKEEGIEVQGFGKGWPSGMLSPKEMLSIYSRSFITLGFGYVGHSHSRIGLKGRDFEIPLTGTAYLTSYNPELAKCFREGEEILFYRDKRELKKTIIDYLKTPERLISIGSNGRIRALKDHLWSDRWKSILDLFFENKFD
jgi:spore maturation protein CgeB